jgi:hypothetical protein
MALQPPYFTPLIEHFYMKKTPVDIQAATSGEVHVGRNSFNEYKQATLVDPTP